MAGDARWRCILSWTDDDDDDDDAGMFGVFVVVGTMLSIDVADVWYVQSLVLVVSSRNSLGGQSNQNLRL